MCSSSAAENCLTGRLQGVAAQVRVNGSEDRVSAVVCAYDTKASKDLSTVPETICFVRYSSGSTTTCSSGHGINSISLHKINQLLT